MHLIEPPDPAAPELSPAAERPTVLLTWRLHLAAQQPAKAVLVGACVVLTGVCAQLSLHNPWLTLASSLLLVSSVADFLFPVRYTLTTAGAEVRSWVSAQAIAWEKVRRCYQDAEGLKLSPLPRLTRLERFRGVYLRFAGNREEVLAVVQEQLAARGLDGGKL